MTANIYRCLKLNWLNGQYEWVTFEANSDDEARTVASRLNQCLIDTVSRAQVLHAAA